MAIQHVHDLSTWAWWGSSRNTRDALRVSDGRRLRGDGGRMLALGVGANGAMFSVVDAVDLQLYR